MNIASMYLSVLVLIRVGTHQSIEITEIKPHSPFLFPLMNIT